MKFYWGSNFHGFGYKRLFYVLFVRLTSLHVAGVSSLSAYGVGFVLVSFPGSPTPHSLAPAYLTPTYWTNTLSISTLKLYSSFCGASHGDLSSCTSRESQGHTFLVKTFIKNNIGRINIWVVKKYQTHRTGPYRLISLIVMSMSHSLNAQFFHKRFVRASHQCIL